MKSRECTCATLRQIWSDAEPHRVDCPQRTPHLLEVLRERVVMLAGAYADVERYWPWREAWGWMGKVPPPAYAITSEPDPAPDYDAPERLRDTLHLYCDAYRTALVDPSIVPFPDPGEIFDFLIEIERVAAFGRQIIGEYERRLAEDDVYCCPNCGEQWAGGIGMCLDCDSLHPASSPSAVDP